MTHGGILHSDICNYTATSDRSSPKSADIPALPALPGGEVVGSVGSPTRQYLLPDRNQQNGPYGGSIGNWSPSFVECALTEIRRRTLGRMP